MTRIFTIIAVLAVMLNGPAKAVTHLWFWVNGDTAHVVNQGDTLAWEYDVATPGNTAFVELWIDTDSSRTITAGDVLLEQFTQRDGETDTDGPADSSSTPDGIVYVFLGPFGFAPQHYLLQVVDEDFSMVSNWFKSIAMPAPPATISGNVIIEGKEAPDELFANVMIGALGENGIFSGLTDEYGSYSINLPVSGGDWEIGPFFERTLPGYIQVEEGYQATIPAGNTGGFDFHFTLPRAWVYGDLLDQDGILVERTGFIALENQQTDTESEGQIIQGKYNIPAAITPIGDDSTNYFYLRPDDNLIYPDYMSPPQEEPFPVSIGDSIRRDLMIYATNAVIYGYVTEEEGPPSQAYEFSAYSDTFGYMEILSDPQSGYFEMPVRDGSSYMINLQDNPEWGTPPPPGLIPDVTWQEADPGDTVYFNFSAAAAAIGGSISFDPGDPTEINYNDIQVSAWDNSNQNRYSAPVLENNTFHIGVPDGNYNVNLDFNYGFEYMVRPAQIENITVSADTVDTLNFILNYGHADLKVQLTGAPVELPQTEAYWISTIGEWPEIYTTGQMIDPDTILNYRVCEGEWLLFPPVEINPLAYDVYPQDTVVTVTEQDSSYFVEFVYKLKTAIGQESQIPAKFYLEQNYPNPFNPSTTITYELPSTGRIKLTIYNILGEVIAVLVDKWQIAGIHSVQWQPGDIASGVYLYKIETAERVATKKMILMR